MGQKKQKYATSATFMLLLRVPGGPAWCLDTFAIFFFFIIKESIDIKVTSSVLIGMMLK